MNIEFKEKIDDKIGKMIGEEFEKYAKKNDLECKYIPFAFVAKENEKVVGVLTGKSYYSEIHIGDLIILEEYRGNDLGTKLMEEVENHFKNQGISNINLTTYSFQAPEFYKKCGYELEFIRKNKRNPKLDKYYFVKYF